MAKFVLVYTGGGMPESEEEQAKVMAAWGAWYEGLGQAVLDPGNPFSLSAMNVVPGGAVSEGAIGMQEYLSASQPSLTGFSVALGRTGGPLEGPPVSMCEAGWDAIHSRKIIDRVGV